MLTRDTQRQLLAIARAALEARVRGTRVPESGSKGASQPGQGAFVTIFCKGELRGCLGRVTSDWPLPDLVRHLAQEVADSDPRFTPVAPLELEDIALEVSVLTPEREIRSIERNRVGPPRRHCRTGIPKEVSCSRRCRPSTSGIARPLCHRPA